MYFFEGNYSDSGGSGSIKTKQLTGIKIGTVIKTGTIKVNITDSPQRKRDERFNSDPYIIRCKILDSNGDNTLTDDILPNCLPLMPKHNAIIPKEGETVLIFEYGVKGDPYPERFYIGPIISSLNRLNHQTLYSGSIAGMSISPLNISENIDNLPDTKGVFSEYDRDYGYSIDGRDNCDITFKPSEVLIRGGKFVKNGDNV